MAERGLPVIEVGESGWAVTVTVTVTVTVAVAVASGKVQDTGFCFVGQERVDVKLMMENENVKIGNSLKAIITHFIEHFPLG